jgi:hypothetical protein
MLFIALQPREWTSRRVCLAGDRCCRRTSRQWSHRRGNASSIDGAPDREGRDQERRPQETARPRGAARGVSVQPRQRARVAVQPAHPGRLLPLRAPPRQGPAVSKSQQWRWRRRAQCRSAQARPHGAQRQEECRTASLGRRGA